MEKTILVTPRGYARYGQEARKRLEELGYTMDINDTGKPVPREVFVEKAKEATGIIIGVDELDAELARECKNLKAVVKFGIGVDNIDLPTCEEKSIKVGRWHWNQFQCSRRIDSWYDVCDCKRSGKQCDGSKKWWLVQANRI